MKPLHDSEGGWPNTVNRFLRQTPVSQAASKVRRHLEQRVKVSATFSRSLSIEMTDLSTYVACQDAESQRESDAQTATVRRYYSVLGRACLY